MIKFFKFCLTIVILTVLNGCNDEFSSLSYSNNLEMAKFWNSECNNVHTIVKYNKAHSGNYVSITDSLSRYSYLFKVKMGDVSNKPLLKVNTSIWVKVKNLNADAVVVISVDSRDKNIAWKGVELEPFIVKANEWTEIKPELIFNETSYDSEYTLSFFLWNRGQHEVMLDDISLNFME